MLTLFPDELEPPAGLVTKRLILKLPIWAALTVIMLVVSPLVMIRKLGWFAVVIAVLGIGLAWVIGKAAKDDPDFLAAWIGELQLDQWYE